MKSRPAWVVTLASLFLVAGCIAGFGSLSSIKRELCAGPIRDHVKDPASEDKRGGGIGRDGYRRTRHRQ